MTGRTIKFRGWSTSEKRWHYGYLVELHGGTWINDGNVALLVDPESVGQLIDTTFTDQATYEGDFIANRDGVVWEIYFNKYTLGWSCKNEYGSTSLVDILHANTVTVIGNTYESKLNQKEVVDEA